MRIALAEERLLSHVTDKLVRAQGIGDVDRIYATAVQYGADFNLAYIGPDFSYPQAEKFDNALPAGLYKHANLRLPRSPVAPRHLSLIGAPQPKGTH